MMKLMRTLFHAGTCKILGNRKTVYQLETMFYAVTAASSHQNCYICKLLNFVQRLPFSPFAFFLGSTIILPKTWVWIKIYFKPQLKANMI